MLLLLSISGIGWDRVGSIIWTDTVILNMGGRSVIHWTIVVAITSVTSMPRRSVPSNCGIAKFSVGGIA